MRTDKESPVAGAQDLCGSVASPPNRMNIPYTGPQDLDLLAVEHEALEAAGIPWEWREALRKTLPSAPEEGAPCPGGFGV